MGPREFLLMCHLRDVSFHTPASIWVSPSSCLPDMNEPREGKKTVEIDWKLNQIYMFSGTVCQSDQLVIRIACFLTRSLKTADDVECVDDARTPLRQSYCRCPWAVFWQLFLVRLGLRSHQIDILCYFMTLQTNISMQNLFWRKKVLAFLAVQNW